jgi:hypothetical protein
VTHPLPTPLPPAEALKLAYPDLDTRARQALLDENAVREYAATRYGARHLDALAAHSAAAIRIRLEDAHVPWYLR